MICSSQLLLKNLTFKLVLFVVSSLMKILVSCSSNMNKMAITHTLHGITNNRNRCVCLLALLWVNNSLSTLSDSVSNRRVTERETTRPFCSRLINSHTQWSNITIDTGLFITVTQVSGHKGNFLFRGKISRSVGYWSTIRAAHHQIIRSQLYTLILF